MAFDVLRSDAAVAFGVDVAHQHAGFPFDDFLVAEQAFLAHRAGVLNCILKRRHVPANSEVAIHRLGL